MNNKIFSIVKKIRNALKNLKNLIQTFHTSFLTRTQFQKMIFNSKLSLKVLFKNLWHTKINMVLVLRIKSISKL